MLIEGAFLCIGFAAGILFESGRNYIRERDLLDRLAWRNPSDYWFMKNRRDAELPKGSFKLPFLGALKKKESKLQQTVADPELLAKSLETQVNAVDFGKSQYKEYLKHKEDASKVGAFT